MHHAATVERQVLLSVAQSYGATATADALAEVPESNESNDARSISFVVTSCVGPSITTQPLSQAIQSGGTATLSVAATGLAPLAYQWYQGTSGNTSAPLAGATSQSLTTPAVAATASFWCRVSNPCDHADSATATITVVQAPCTGPYALMIPAAAHSNNQWQSDVDIANLGPGAAFVDLALLKANQANTSPSITSVVVPAGQAMRLRDVLGALLPASNAALGVRFCAGSAFVNSRFYNVKSRCGGTYGMWVPAAAESAAVTPARRGVFHHLSYSPDTSRGFRVNIGFANASSFRVTVVITLLGDDGSVLGVITKTLQAYEHFQYTRIHALVGAPAVDHGIATVDVTTGGGKVHTYAMLIDNVSLDPMYMPVDLQ